MTDPLKIPIRASTQEHLEIEDVQNDIAILKDGSCCLVISTTAINFGLLSEKEQDAAIYAYAALLNSLTFPIQILIRSKRKNISSYLALIDMEIEKQTNKLLKEQMVKYRRFVEETVKKNNVLDKEFYVVLPFTALELGVTKAIGSAITGKSKNLPYSKEYILEKAKMNLYPKRDQVIRQFNRLGLKTQVLNSADLVRLFFSIYNPESAEIRIIGNGQDYTSSMVRASDK
ncbi:MAG: hypothetical protein Q7S03_02095 [bacterium]|nr:hypothetical protein [bacterium]